MRIALPVPYAPRQYGSFLGVCIVEHPSKAQNSPVEGMDPRI